MTFSVEYFINFLCFRVNDEKLGAFFVPVPIHMFRLNETQKYISGA